MTTALWIQAIVGFGEAPAGFIFAVTVWLWFNLVRLILTTIAALLSAIGIAGMSRTVKAAEAGQGVCAPAAEPALDERLGGDTVILRGPYIDTEIVAYARDHNVAAIVIGRTRERARA